MELTDRACGKTFEDSRVTPSQYLKKRVSRVTKNRNDGRSGKIFYRSAYFLPVIIYACVDFLRIFSEIKLCTRLSARRA